MINHAKECANKAGRYSFGVDEAKTAEALRKLADEIETGKVALFSVSSSTHARHEEFTVREVVIEVLEEISSPGPKMIRD